MVGTQWEVEIKSNVSKVIEDVRSLEAELGKLKNAKDSKVEVDVVGAQGKLKSLEKQIKNLQLNIKTSQADDKLKKVNEKISDIKDNIAKINTAFLNVNSSGLSDVKKTLNDMDKTVQSIVKNISKFNNIKNPTKNTRKKDRALVSDDDFLNNLDSYTAKADAAISKLGGKILGGTSTAALENGIVKVSAKIKEATGAWTSFTARIDGDGNLFNARFAPITKNIDVLEKQLAGVRTDVGNTSTKVAQTAQTVNFKPNTDGFSEIVTLLGIAEDKAKNIKDIVKESRVNSQGTYDESYNVRYKDGSSYRYEGANGDIVNANERVKNDNAELEKQKNLYDQINTKLKKLEELKTKQAKGTATRYETGQIGALEKELTKLRSDPILSKEQFDESGRELQRITEKVKELQRVTNSKNVAKRVQTVKNYFGGLDSERAFVVRTENKPQENMTSTEIEKVRNLKLALNEYEAKLRVLKGEDYVTEAQLQQVENARQKYLAAKAVIQQMPKADKGAAAVGVSKMLNNIDKYISKNSAMSAKYKRQLQALKQELMDKGPGANLADIQSRFERLQVEIREAGQEGKRFLDVIKEKAWYGLATQLGTYFNLNSLINGMRRGIEVVKEMDTALTEMRKVSDESLSSLKAYQKESFASANSVGTTAQQIQKSTADWMRLGESMTKAKESAKVSNILFNVSEFENIDAATDALVSMSAAYKDVEKIDIVNKMNKIGNEFSISTDGLATSLQDSASSLITAGNSIDEAIALTTAGNAVSQDPSKVGSGLRTISLRLVGTKAAREALNELGEETDDFITSSKLRQTIKQATSAATENGEGFDVLNSNGNYKSTYQIMLGLSELYDKIQQKDKEMGTNNLNLLLEAIAGKNRSNIAASILQNPEMLKSVYASSQNAEGSAQEELNKYLDSVEAKFAKLQNEAQRFWVTFISSDTAKRVIENLTSILSTITNIIDKIGSVPALLTAIGAGLAFKNVGRAKCRLLKYAYSNKISRAKCEFYILPSVRYTVEFADMASRCIWTHPLMIEGREVA